MIDWVFDILNRFWVSFCLFIGDLLDFVFSIPSTVINFCISCFLWVRSECYSLSINFVIGCLDKLKNIHPVFSIDYDYLNDLLGKINIFFPVDTLLEVLFFLITTWVIIQFYRVMLKIGLRYLVTLVFKWWV